MTNVFFCRCRPQHSDPIEIVLREKRVFIGYPAWLKDVKPQRGKLRAAMIDVQCTDEEWASLSPRMFTDDHKMYSQNRNFARSITCGDIALVPRPSKGVVYAGYVVQRFEVLDDAPWVDEYLELRKNQDLDIEDVFSHIGDVVQCCKVDNFRAISFAVIPAWIRRSLLGRSTFGLIKPPQIMNLDPYSALETIIKNPRQVTRNWTIDPPEVERRLVESVGPTRFEHLCVDLLQLEYPEEIWEHVGGSGDGGLDGVGMPSDNPEQIGLLQCKWAYWGEDIQIKNRTDLIVTRKILASLLHNEEIHIEQGIEFWSRQKIANLIIKHAQSLPLAISLRIGKK